MIPPWMWQKPIAAALEEDIGFGDITTDAIFRPDDRGALLFCARESLVSCGMVAISETYRQLSAEVTVEILTPDGTRVSEGTVMARASGPSRALLTGERVPLNFAQRLSGIATTTRAVVDQLEGLATIVLDTRKTTPGWRVLERWATSVGGARNHRFNLSSAALIKDNHIAAAGGIEPAVRAVKHALGPMVYIEVEVDRLDQIAEALSAGPSAILLDNMNVETLTKAVALIDRRVFTEASGGVRPHMVRAIAETGVDAISLGWLTHSAPAVDIGAEWEAPTHG